MRGSTTGVSRDPFAGAGKTSFATHIQPTPILQMQLRYREAWRMLSPRTREQNSAHHLLYLSSNHHTAMHGSRSKVTKASYQSHVRLSWRFTGELKKRKPDSDGSSVLKTPTPFFIASPWVSPSLHKDTWTASVKHAANPEFLGLYRADCILTKGWLEEREKSKKSKVMCPSPMISPWNQTSM